MKKGKRCPKLAVKGTDPFTGREVIHHQPDTDSGFSATLFKNKDTNTPQPYVFAIRGTSQLLEDLLTADLLDIVTDGVAIDQIVDMWNYWKQLTTPKGESFTGSRVVTLVTETAALAFANLNPLRLVPGSNLIGNAYREWLYSRDDIIIDNSLLGERVRTIETVLGDSNFTGILDTPLEKDQLLSVTGHSLGGHLSAALTRLVPGIEALTINGAGFPTGNLPGLGGDAKVNIRNLFGMLGGGDTGFNSSRILNLHGDKNFEFITQNTELGLLQQGGQEAIFIEQKELKSFTYGHGAGQMTDSLAVYDLLTRLDAELFKMSPAAMLNKLQPLFEQASNQPEASLESIVNSIGDLLKVGSRVSIDIREQLYVRLQAINNELYLNSTLAEPQLKPQYQNLKIVEVASLSDSEKLDNTEGLAYRYALTQLNTFAITGNIGLYNVDELAADKFSDQYLIDRARFLELKIKLALTDSTAEPLPLTPEYFEDKASELIIDNRTTASSLPSRESDRFIFGDEQNNTDIVGGNKTDHLYGGAGDDILAGGKGNDYLEGGIGNDTLDGGKGNDRLLGGAGHDTYLFNAGDERMTIKDSDGDGRIVTKSAAGDKTLGSGIKLLAAGGSVYKDQDDNIYTYGANRLLIKLAEGGDIIIEDFSSGQLGITLPTASGSTSTPPAATQTIIGDRDYKDFDLATDGIQTQVDALGNIITTDTEKQQTDHLLGSEEADLIQSGALDDIINGKGGGDIIEGGSGDIDLLQGGAGDDYLYADQATDFSSFINDTQTPADTTRDLLSGGDDNDQLIGNAGSNALYGGKGYDRIAAGAGDDFIFGDDDPGAVAGLVGWNLIGNNAVVRGRVPI